MVDDWILKELLEDASNGGTTIDEAAEAMIRAALGGGGVDNVTAVLVRVIELQRATEPLPVVAE